MARKYRKKGNSISRARARAMREHPSQGYDPYEFPSCGTEKVAYPVEGWLDFDMDYIMSKPTVMPM